MLPVDKGLFPRTKEVAYLDTAAEGLPPVTAREAMEQYLDAKMSGSTGRPLLYRIEQEAIGAAARLLGAEPANVTFLAHASDALNILANSLEWKPGDEVVLTDLEFPSNVVAWLRLRDRGVKVNVVASEGGDVPLDRLQQAITARTKLVSVSYVSYVTGARMGNMAELAATAHKHGAVVCLDATQALGRVLVPLEGIDFLVASSYKWLLGIHGLGVVYVAPELSRRLRPSTAGWYSIQNVFAPDRFERFLHKEGAGALQSGMPSFGSIAVLKASLEYLLTIGVENIDQGMQPVVSHLRQGLADLGLKLLTPPSAAAASGIVSFTAAEPEKLSAKLQEEGVIVWGGDKRVRASVHLYNDEADVNALLAALSRIGVPR